jgi:RNase H-fold protein (predicted Holliday junction resolvase)
MIMHVNNVMSLLLTIDQLKKEKMNSDPKSEAKIDAVTAVFLLTHFYMN